MWRVCIALLSCVLLPVVATAQTSSHPQGMATAAVVAAEAPSFRKDLPRIQRLVDDLRARLVMPETILVSVVPNNSRMAAVGPLNKEETIFRLWLDDSFLDSLSEEELRAALAHELGHVWVFTHHPYLQTEKLANEIAMRLVSRDSLVRLYEKMWKHLGTSGDVAGLVGD